jgi:hypothetical protein
MFSRRSLRARLIIKPSSTSRLPSASGSSNKRDHPLVRSQAQCVLFPRKFWRPWSYQIPAGPRARSSSPCADFGLYRDRIEIRLQTYEDPTVALRGNLLQGNHLWRRNKITPSMSRWTLAASRKSGAVRFTMTGASAGMFARMGAARCLKESVDATANVAHAPSGSDSRTLQSASCDCPQISGAA